MPRLKPSDAELKRRAVRQVIIGNQELYAVNDKELSKITNRHPDTLRRRKENPENWTLGELWSAGYLLKFTPEQMIQLISGKPQE